MVVTFLTCKATGSGHLQMLYADTFGRIIHLGMEQLIENLGRFVKYSAMYEVLSGGGREETTVVQLSSTGYKYLVLYSEWFGYYLLKELGALYKRYFANVSIAGNVSIS